MILCGVDNMNTFGLLTSYARFMVYIFILKMIHCVYKRLKNLEDDFKAYPTHNILWKDPCPAWSE